MSRFLGSNRLHLLLPLFWVPVLLWFALDPLSSPYRGVDVRKAERVGSEVHFVANFTKTNCKFQRLRVVASIADETRFLAWRDLDKLPENEDRGQGRQTLRIGINALPGFDWIEIRTRHDCDGKKVDRVFHRIEPAP